MHGVLQVDEMHREQRVWQKGYQERIDAIALGLRFPDGSLVITTCKKCHAAVYSPDAW